jgi:DNA-binding NarL/FixJ family response regulator
MSNKPLSVPKKIRIVLCNSSPLFRKGVKALVREQSALLEVVGEAETGREAVEQVRRLRPDVVLMDVLTQKLSGTEATRRIKKVNPDVSVLILTLYDNQRMVSECLQAGASDYIGPGAPLAELEKRISDVCARERPRAA